MNAMAATPAKPHRTMLWGILPDRRRVPHGWPTCLRRQPPRIAFRNNNIYRVNDEESNIYEEPVEKCPKVLYKSRVSKDPMSKNMPHMEEFHDNNYESIDETAV